MDKIEYEKRRDDLFERWEKERPEYNAEGKQFIHDGGITNFEKWIKTKPKILFLLKDAYDWFEPNLPVPINKKFGLNITRWKYAIRKLYENTNEMPLYPANNDDLREWANYILNDDIALMEVKKVDDGSKNAPEEIIKWYAEKDKIFLQEQIELINPQIILCGMTFSSYKIIYDYEPEISGNLKYLRNDEEGIDASIFTHNKRAIIHFYHPSCRVSPDKLYELLCGLFIEGKVFEKFSWGKFS